MYDASGCAVKSGSVYADNRSEAISNFIEKYNISSEECYLCSFDAEKDD